jgi:hypothetical protein
MRKRTFEYDKGYVLDYIFFPGRGGSDSEIEGLLSIIRGINQKGMKLDYGIFNDDFDKAILNDLVVCLIRKEGEYHGFFYAAFVNEKLPLVHQGLIMIIKNDGADLLTAPYFLLNQLIFEELDRKPYFATNITAMPKSVGAFCDLFSNVWPAPSADLIKCPYPEYRALLDELLVRYIKKIFPYPEETKICKNRFVLSSKVTAMGFKTDFHQLARDARFEMNLFTFMWLKHDQEEDMIQVGRYTESNYEDAKAYRLLFKENY